MLSSATKHQHVEHMLHQIHQSYTRRLTLAALARALGRQSAYLGRLFREQIGVTVHEYITRARMQYGAVHVLSGAKIEAVALDSGYQSKKNFYRQFKRYFGMTPDCYRQQRQAANRAPAAAPGSGAHNSQFTREGRRPLRPTSPAEQLMAQILVDSRIAMLLTDENGCCVGGNKAAVLMTGYSADELNGMPVEVLLPNGSCSDNKCRLKILLMTSSLPMNAALRTKWDGPVRAHLISIESFLGEREDSTFAATG